MKVVEIQQGTPEWHLFRANGLGSSDAPVIMGVSPYRTPLELFKEKLRARELAQAGLAEAADPDKEFIFAKGHRTEALIRNQFQELTGVEMKPICLIHDKWDHIRASLDGFDKNKFGVLEAKLVGKAVLEQARSPKRMKIRERIPLAHFVQIQEELEVADVDLGHWFGHDGEGTGVLLEIRADRSFQKEMLNQMHGFWERLRNNEAPPLSDRDYLLPEDVSLLQQLRDAKELQDNAAAQYEEIKRKVLEAYKHTKIAGAGLKVFKVERQGSLDLLSVPEIATAVERVKKRLKPAYLEQYRKKGSSSWNVTIEKSKKETA